MSSYPVPTTAFEERFVALFEAEFARLFRYLDRLSGEPELAADLAQDAFMKAYKARHTWRPDQQPRVWLHRIAVNTAISHARRNTVQRRVLEKLGRLEASSAPQDPTVGADGDLLDALRALKPPQRAAVVLHYYHGFQYAEIAEILGVPAGTVGSRISIALKQTRERLKQAGMRRGIDSSGGARRGTVLATAAGPETGGMNLEIASGVGDIEI